MSFYPAHHITTGEGGAITTGSAEEHELYVSLRNQGRLETSSVVVQDPSVSKVHAMLRWTDGGCLLRDAGSMNGTYVNSVQLGSEEQELLDGDGLAFGDAQFLYVSAETLHAHLNAAVPAAR